MPTARASYRKTLLYLVSGCDAVRCSHYEVELAVTVQNGCPKARGRVSHARNSEHWGSKKPTTLPRHQPSAFLGNADGIQDTVSIEITDDGIAPSLSAIG